MRTQKLVAASIWVCGAALMTALSFLASTWPRFPGDLELSLLIQDVFIPGTRQAMEAVSFLGEPRMAYALLFAVSTLLWIRGRRRECLFLLATVVPDVINIPVKELIGRERPDPSLVQVLDPGSSKLGFPSGHAVHFVVFYGMLMYLLPNVIRNGSIVRVLSWAMGMLIVLAGVSRVYLGAHWPSDVLSGYLSGALYLSALVILYKVTAGKHGRHSEAVNSGPPSNDPAIKPA